MPQPQNFTCRRQQILQHFCRTAVLSCYYRVTQSNCTKKTEINPLSITYLVEFFYNFFNCIFCWYLAFLLPIFTSIIFVYAVYHLPLLSGKLFGTQFYLILGFPRPEEKHYSVLGKYLKTFVGKTVNANYLSGQATDRVREGYHEKKLRKFRATIFLY